MGLDRVRAPSVSIEALNLYALLSDPKSASLGSQTDLAAFVQSVQSGLTQSLADERRIHGRWAQDLFRAVLISLDDILMIKDEDAGDFYCDPQQPLKLPDFRVATRAGEHLLIEVKNVNPTAITRPQKLRATDIAAQQRYAQLTGARLLLAHYWAALNQWTLVDSQALTPQGEHLVLDLNNAMRANELGLLGDRVILTASTLVLSLSDDPADAEQPGEIDPEFLELSLPFVVRAATFTCDGKPVTDPIERELAKALFFYGGGVGTFELAVDEHDRPLGLTITCSSPAGPESPHVGSNLSKIYTNRYIVATKRADGSVARIRHDPDPTLTRLIPSDFADRPGRVVPMIVLHQFPAGRRPGFAPPPSDA